MPRDDRQDRSAASGDYQRRKTQAVRASIRPQSNQDDGIRDAPNGEVFRRIHVAATLTSTGGVDFPITCSIILERPLCSIEHLA
jgi:hypothetical protein